MKTIFKNLKTVSILVIVGAIVSSLLSNIQAVGELFSFVQSVFMLILVLFVLPLALYKYNTGKRDKLKEGKAIFHNVD